MTVKSVLTKNYEDIVDKFLQILLAPRVI